MSSTAETLRRARALIEDPDRWCRGELKAVKEGGVVQRCAYGAIPYDNVPAARLLRDAAHELYGEMVVDVNDILGHAAVMHMYDRAIEMAEEQDDAE